MILTDDGAFHPLLSFEVIHYDNGQDALIAIEGELDSHTAPQLRDAVSEALQGRPQRVYVDLTDVAFLDSSGLSALAGSHRRANRQGSELILCSPQPPVLRALELTGFSDYISIQ